MNNSAIICGVLTRLNKANVGGRDILNATVRTSTKNGDKVSHSFIPVQISMPTMVSKYESLAVNTRVSVEGRFETYTANNRKNYNLTQLTSFQPTDEGDMNHTMIWGRITGDVQMRQTQNGTRVCSASIANSRSYRTKNDEWKEVTSFIDITAWGDMADTLATFNKGEAIWVIGRLVSDSYTNKNNEKVYTTKVVADSITSGGSGKRNIVDETAPQYGNGSTQNNQTTPPQTAKPVNKPAAKPNQKPTSMPQSSDGFAPIDDFVDEDELPF